MLYNIALSQLKGVGIATAAKLLDFAEGSSETLFQLSQKELVALSPHLKNILSEKSKNEALRLAEEELNFTSKNNITPLFFKDAAYPSRLKECKGAPIILYSKGVTNLNALRCLSIVGTRQPTQRGIDSTKAIIKEISELFPDTLIISGLAYGVDVTAHKAALYNKLPTAAVLGHGLQMLYPAMHRNIAERIVNENGALLSQYTSKSNVLPQNFIERNAVVAGMADATLIIESKERGGAMATAQIANSFSRDVLAIPGSIYEEKSKGCNKLIKSQIAALVESAKDIGYALCWEARGSVSQQQLLFELSEEEQQVSAILQQKGKVSLDALCSALNVPTHTLLPIITQLELKDILHIHPGKFYSLKK